MSNYLNHFRLSPQALWNLPLLCSNTEQMSDSSSRTSSGRSLPYIGHVFFSCRETSPLDSPCENLAASLLRVYLLCGLVEFFGGFLATERRLCRVSEPFDAQQSIWRSRVPPNHQLPPCKKKKEQRFLISSTVSVELIMWVSCVIPALLCARLHCSDGSYQHQAHTVKVNDFLLSFLTAILVFPTKTVRKKS